MRWSEADEIELRRLWDIHGGGFRKIAAVMGRTRGSIDGKSRTLGLQFKGGRAKVLENGHPALKEKRTIYPHRVVPPDENVLKTGDNQRKLGRMVTKGKWKGFPVFSLTLEERATCPTTCTMWRGCYGNNSGHAKRYRHGVELQLQIVTELARLAEANPRGFVVRLHQLGDFYSVAYVRFWGQMLDEFPALHIFGYTAWLSNTSIGSAVEKLRTARWDRFAVRTSGARRGPRTMVFHAKPPKGVIACPAQDGKTANCSSCALCWGSTKPIGFRAH